MSRIELFPPRLLFDYMLEETIAWIKELPGRAIDKKLMLIEWCSWVGVKLTKELVDRVYRWE